MTEKQKKNPQCRPRAKIAARLHLEALFRTISTRPGLSSGKRLSVGPPLCIGPWPAPSISGWAGSKTVCQTSKWIWYD